MPEQIETFHPIRGQEIQEAKPPRIGATLAFRNCESRTYYWDIPGLNMPNLYAVALIDGHFPWRKIEPSSDHIVACLEYTTWTHGEGWGWTHLEPDTKYTIGYDLMGMGVEPDQWVYLVIGEQEEVQSPICIKVFKSED